MDTLTLRRSADLVWAGDRGRSRALLRAGAGAAAAACAAGAVAAAPGYASPLGAALALVPWAPAAVVLTLLLLRRLSHSAALLTGAAAALAGTLLLALAAPGTRGDPLADVLAALPNAGARILGSVPPLPVMVDTLLLPALATWLGGAVAAVAWSTGRPLTALLPGVLLLTGGTALSASASAALWAAALLAASAGLLLAVSSAAAVPGTVAAPGFSAEAAPARTGRGGGAGRWALRAGACVAVCAIAATAAPAVFATWQARPLDPRAGLRPHAVPEAAPNPLGYLSVWAAHPDTPLLEVESNRANVLRWVALADFTGTTWLPESRYRTTGRVLPAPDPAPPHATRQEVGITLTGLPGPWLPVVGAPRSLDAPGAAFDAASGTAVLARDGAEGLAYTVSGDVAQWRAGTLTGRDVPRSAAFDQYRRLPEDVPEEIIGIAAQASADGEPYDHAVRLARYLRTGYTFDPRAPSGHGLADLRRLLVEPGRQGGGGTSEQFASAFAVLARAAGLPSRVVVGFGPGGRGEDGTATVTTGDAIAWGEVYFSGVGWVPFDVTPGGREEGGDPEEPAAVGAQDSGLHSVGRPDGADWAPAADAAARQGGDPARVWLAPGAAAAGAAGAVLLVLLLRTLRSRRRLAAGRPPVETVLGAWRELRENLRLAGTGGVSGSTVTTVIRAAAGADPKQGGMRRLRSLHRCVNDLAFGPTRSVSKERAGRAAAEVREYVRDLRAGQPRTRRWSWWLDPRPLFWREW
ncbi:transglutaminase domain-containing protein [Streptomonospora sp. PA3]|uniref:transglutaminase-like domain-containing protein n=1 Tax=Streptomonospora sp. PA3 TaxID=2607326 RepID=UPI0012DC5420|nr:transglutaminase-like domain-containing protein [Streptomonospora sp. PA3]MUL42930.1 transglutaminase domain-containing protein [Streptomonospora sp. PA3]